MFSYILSKVGKESIYEPAHNQGYSPDPNDFKAIAVVKKSAGKECMNCKQGSYVSIVDFKRHTSSVGSQ